MRRIDVTNYSVRVRGQDGNYTELPYDMKDSMVEALLARDLQLSGTALLESDELARKIMSCTDGSIILEEAEWLKLVHALNTIKGLGRPDVDFVHRIFEAEKVEVEEKK